MTYTYIEAKSNYHRGSILILRYVLINNRPIMLILFSKATLSSCQDFTLHRAALTSKIRFIGMSL